MSYFDLPLVTTGMVGWIAFYGDKRLEIRKTETVDSLYKAKLVALDHFKPPKSKRMLVSVTPAHDD